MKKLSQTLNLPVMDEVADIDPVQEWATPDQVLSLVEGKDHGDAMDLIHKETLQIARDLSDLGFNIDHARARGMFEQSANFFKIAADVKTAKRDAELKALRMALEEKKINVLLGNAVEKPTGAIPEEIVLSGDRNEILKKLREGND
jgi:isopropylmalate/homocitrate/citramalate synthase